MPVRIVPRPKDTQELPLEASVPLETLDEMIDRRKLVLPGVGQIDLVLTKPDIDDLRTRGLAQVYPAVENGEPASKPILLKVRPQDVWANIGDLAPVTGTQDFPRGSRGSPVGVTRDDPGIIGDKFDPPRLPSLPMVLICHTNKPGRSRATPAASY